MKKKGISLIVLIITIVVIIILATAIIVNIAQTNLIGNANEAVVKQDFKTMQDEINLYIADKYADTLGKFKAEDLDVNDEGKIAEIIPSIVGTKYQEYVVIEEGKISISDTMPEPEKTWAMEALGLVKTSTTRPTPDTEVPTVPTILELTVDGNKITVVASGSTDNKGTVTYEYSIDNISWQTSGEFTDLEYKQEYTVYARAVDKAGNKSDVIEEKAITVKLYKSRDYIVEVFGHYRGNYANINEIEFYDENGNKIEYTVSKKEAYDSVFNGVPEYWTYTLSPYGIVWGYENLNDGEIVYKGVNSTVFLSKTGVNTYGGNSYSWARFILQIEEGKNVKDIRASVGDISYDVDSSIGGRTPKSVSIYEVDEYSDTTYAKNIKQRNNEGLTLVNTINFAQEYGEPTWFSFTE